MPKRCARSVIRLQQTRPACRSKSTPHSSELSVAGKKGRKAQPENQREQKMTDFHLDRRELLKLSSAAVALVSAPTIAIAQSGQFTDWGWPQPYEKVAQKSLDWLNQQG